MVFQAIVPREVARRSTPAHFHLRPRLYDELDGLFDGLWREVGAAGLRDQAFVPRVDVEDADDALRFAAELPGFEAAEFEVVVEGCVLTIRTVKTSEETEDADGETVRVRSRREFSRSFRIPFDVDAESVSGSYRNGLLTVTVPKPAAPESLVHTVPVTTD
ncbi:MAG: Hsp20/alpha crystallin family protein [Myxococcota bacterium]